MRSLAQARGWNNLSIVGYVQPERIPAYQVAADVLVLPNSARYEISRTATSPLKLFEYMASGSPIVASDLPALREVLTPDNALLVTPDSSTALTVAFARLLADEPLRNRLAAQARQDVATHTWAARAKSILQFAGSKVH